MEIASRSPATVLVGVALMCLTVARAQNIVAVTQTNTNAGLDGLDTVEFTRTNLNFPTSTEWRITLSLINYFPIVGFDFWLYLGEFGAPGITVTGFEDPANFINLIPGFSTVFEENVIQGGTLNIISDPQAPIFIPANCLFPADINPFDMPTSPPDCSGVEPVEVLEIFITTSEPATPNDILVGGPPTSSIDMPVFAITAIIQPHDDLGTPAPTPAPIPPPPVATIKSDPHFQGIRGQEFDVEGEEGKIYNLITEKSPTDRNRFDVVLNALFSQAYATGISLGSSMDVKNYHPRGTWISQVGLMINGISVQIDVAKPETSDLNVCLIQYAECLKYGTVSTMGSPFLRVGKNYIAENIVIEIWNSKSFSRVIIQAEKITLRIDIVRPPDSWNIGAEDFSSFSHLNLEFANVSLENSAGIIGETANYKYDQSGKPILKSKTKNGDDILSHPLSDYEVPQLFSPMIEG